ncbi:unnamed protein product [Amoebophrya sp. A120]|nr:unnamed protein product [Amoebophrya sp. A120]|eukprot:GSA120T00005695001.1
MVILSHRLGDPHLVELQSWLSNRTLRNFLSHYSEDVWPHVVKTMVLLGIYALQYSGNNHTSTTTPSMLAGSKKAGNKKQQGKDAETSGTADGSSANRNSSAEPRTPGNNDNVVWSMEDLENLLRFCANEEEWPKQLQPELFRGAWGEKVCAYRKPNGQWRAGQKEVYRPRGPHDKSTPSFPTQTVYEPDEAQTKASVYPTWWSDQGEKKARQRTQVLTAADYQLKKIRDRNLRQARERKRPEPILEEDSTYSSSSFTEQEIIERFRREKAKKREQRIRNAISRGGERGGAMPSSRRGPVVGGQTLREEFLHGGDFRNKNNGYYDPGYQEPASYASSSLGVDSADCVHALNECTKSPKAWSVSFPSTRGPGSTTVEQQKPSYQPPSYSSRPAPFAHHRRRKRDGQSAVELTRSFLANPALRQAFGSPGSTSPVGSRSPSPYDRGGGRGLGVENVSSPGGYSTAKGSCSHTPGSALPLDERRPRPWAAAYNMSERSEYSERREAVGDRPPNSFVAWHEGTSKGTSAADGVGGTGVDLEELLVREESDFRSVAESSTTNFRL